jgi:hypothetical protein
MGLQSWVHSRVYRPVLTLQFCTFLSINLCNICRSTGEDEAMLSRIRTAAALVAIFVRAGASLYSADRPITIGMVIDGGDSRREGASAGLSHKGHGTTGESRISRHLPRDRCPSGRWNLRFRGSGGADVLSGLMPSTESSRSCSVLLTCTISRSLSPALVRQFIRSGI